LDDARWDAHGDTVTDQYPGEIYTKMLVIHLVPTEDYTTVDEDYSFAVHKTSGVLSTIKQSTSVFEGSVCQADENFYIFGHKKFIFNVFGQVKNFFENERIF